MSRGMVIPAVVYFSCVGNHVVLRVHNLTLKVGLFLFHSPTLVLSKFITSLSSLWLTCFFFSPTFRCKAFSFPEYFTQKSSTIKVKFIVRLLCFHSPGFLLEGCYPYGSRCFNRASCAIHPAWGSLYIPFVTLA